MTNESEILLTFLLMGYWSFYDL